LTLNFLAFSADFWMILGLVLIIVDIFLASFFLLPIGISALIVSGALYFFIEEVQSTGLMTSWRDILLWFAALSVISIFLMQLFVRIRKKDRKDINQY